MTMRPVEPDAECDRCGHKLRVHAGPHRRDFVATGAICLVGRASWSGSKNPCPCDGFVLVPKVSA